MSKPKVLAEIHIFDEDGLVVGIERFFRSGQTVESDSGKTYYIEENAPRQPVLIGNVERMKEALLAVDTQLQPLVRQIRQQQQEQPTELRCSSCGCRIVKGEDSFSVVPAGVHCAACLKWGPQ